VSGHQRDVPLGLWVALAVAAAAFAAYQLLR
jgi:hypothetical protein